MIKSDINLDSTIQKYIDNYLDAIEEELKKTKLSRGERLSILDDVQSHILEMLASQTKSVPTIKDIKSVIANLDSPEDYAIEATIESQMNHFAKKFLIQLRNAFSSEKLAIILSFYGLMIPFVCMVGERILFSNSFRGGGVYFTIFLAFQITAFISGLRSRQKQLGLIAMAISGVFCIVSLMVCLMAG